MATSLLRGAGGGGAANASVNNSSLTTASNLDLGCGNDNCPIVVVLCCFYLVCAMQDGYEYTFNRSPVILISNMQLALATQALVRAAAIVILFAVPSEDIASQWRLLVLSDVPGLAFCCIFVLTMTAILSKLTEGDRAKRCIHLSVFVFTCANLIAWFIAVAFLTSENVNGTNIADIMRLVVFAVLSLLVILLASVAWYLAARTPRDDIIQEFGVDKAPLQWACPVVVVCFSARLLCLLFLQIDGNLYNTTEKWMVVLVSTTALYSVFVVAYFLAGEILCSIMVTCQASPSHMWSAGGMYRGLEAH
jgi:hypothetical protein